MADYEEEDDNIMVCPFFLNSTCRNGDNCEFAHTITQILPQNVACEFHQRGMCKYGRKCWFSHDKFMNNSEIIDKSERVDSEKPADADSSKVKKRFSYVLKDIREKRIKDMLNWIYTFEITRSIPELTKDDAKLPMDRCIDHYEFGDCLLKDWCPCVHGKLCELCQKYCLDPNDKNQQIKHIEECEKELEKDMELSFGIRYSIDKTCGICLEVVIDKENISHRRFGILKECNHVFCLVCIREWRRTGRTMDPVNADATVDKLARRKCPHCRTHSDFVIPSNFWFLTQEEKLTLIEKYKSNLKSKHCKYFNKGIGDCPFGSHCFYLHALPDGSIVELPPPTRQNRHRQNRHRDNQMDENIIMWNYLEQNEGGVQFYIDDISNDGGDIVML